MATTEDPEREDVRGSLVSNPGSTTTPDYTRYSKGYTATTDVVGDTLKSLAQDTGQIIPAIDRTNKVRVQEEVRATVERADMNAYGIDYITTSDGVPFDNLPEDAKRQMKKLKQAESRWRAGKINTTHYWNTLHSASKDIRSRYPGYVNEIDAAFASLTGTTPANALRREVQRNATAGAASAGAVVKANLKEIELARTQGVLPPDMIAAVAKNPTAVASDPALMERIRYRNIKEQFDKAGERRDKTELERLKARNELTDDQALRTGTRIAQRYINREFQDTDWKKFQEEAYKLAQLGDKADPNAIKAISANYITRKTQILSNIQTAIADAGLSPDQNKKIMDNINAQFKIFDDIIADKNFGMFGVVARTLKLDQDAAVSTRFKESALAREYYTQRKLIGDAAFNTFLTKYGTATLSDNVQKLLLAAKADQRSSRTITETVERIKNMDETVSPENQREFVKAFFALNSEVILNGTSDPKAIQESFRSVYRDQAGLTKLPINSRNEVYDRFTSPEIIKSIRDLKAKGILNDTDIIQFNNTVAAWSTIRYKPDVDSVLKFSNDALAFSITYDTSSRKFTHNAKAYDKRRATGGPTRVAEELDEAKRIYVPRMNDIYDKVRRIYTSSGLPEDDAHSLTLAILGKAGFRVKKKELE